MPLGAALLLIFEPSLSWKTESGNPREFEGRALMMIYDIIFKDREFDGVKK